MTRENALRKVRALLNTAAKGSGATDSERETANRLADQLALAHGLNDPRREAPEIIITFNVMFTQAAESAFRKR